MTRLIPWALPTIPGDSEGGYTPQPTPGPIREDPYIFTDAVVSTSTGVANKVTVDSSNRVGGSQNKITGIVPNAVSDVASMRVSIYFSETIYANLPIVLETLTFKSSWATIQGGTLTAGNHAIVRCVYFVYNSAGAIIQQVEKVVS